MVRRRIPPPPPDSSAFRIREGSAADMAFVRDVSAEVFTQFGDYGAFLPSYLEHPSVFTVVAEDQGRPMGFLMLALVASTRVMPWEAPTRGEPEEVLDAEVLAIAVAPEHQSRKVGTRLMEYAVSCAMGWHRTVAVRSLQLNVAHTNHRAHDFFTRQGFVEVDPSDGFYPRGQRSIRMARRLP
jgi:ribosomal protein S18 acetylase RimI-like enzyme